MPPKPPHVTYLLEQGKLKDIKLAKQHVARYLKYQWEYYSELAYQRNLIHDELKKILIESSITNYRFDKW